MEVKGDACGLRAKQLHPDDLGETQDSLKSIGIVIGWEFRQVGIETAGSPGWLPVSRFPTNVHADLLHHRMIPDPTVAKNEGHCQWVGKRAWAYRTKFPCPSLSPAQKAVIAFDGLDTHATVLLNGNELLKTKNMFVRERLDVTKHLNILTENELEIIFESSYLIGKKLVESDPGHKYGCWNGRPSPCSNTVHGFFCTCQRFIHM